MIHTTINLHPEFYEYLFTEYASHLKVSYTELACIIMKCVSEEMPQRERPRRAVEYQRSPYEGKTNWVVVHLYLTDEEYDHFVDMRTFFKMSVSHMITQGLTKYSNHIFCEKWPDKNLFPRYSFGQVIVSGRPFFIIGWGKLTKFTEMTSYT